MRLDKMSADTMAELTKLPVHARCSLILDEFDEWLAVRVLWLKLSHEELPQLNDAFRDYFVGTRTAGGSL